MVTGIEKLPLIEPAQKIVVKIGGNGLIRKRYVERTKQWYKVDWFDHTQEVGGLIFGHRQRNGLLKITDISQLPNKAEHKEKEYKLPNTLYLFLKSIKYFIQLKSVIGEWHSHLSGLQFPSPADKLAIEPKVKKQGLYILGIACWKKGIRTFVYGVNEQTREKYKGD